MADDPSKRDQLSLRRTAVDPLGAALTMYEILEKLDAMWSSDDFGSPDSNKSKRLLTDKMLEIWRAVRAALALARGEPTDGR